MLSIPNHRCQKSWSTYIQIRWTRRYEDYCPTDKYPFGFFALYFFLSLQRAHSVLHIMLYRLFLGVNSVTLSESRYVSTECLVLHYGEELSRLIIQSSAPQAFSLPHPVLNQFCKSSDFNSSLKLLSVIFYFFRQLIIWLFVHTENVFWYTDVEQSETWRSWLPPVSYLFTW